MAFCAWKAFEARAQARGWGLALRCRGSIGHRVGLPRLAGIMQCVIWVPRYSSARRDCVQGRALREAKGDSAAAALRRSWMPVVVSVVLQQSLQGWREAFDAPAKPRTLDVVLIAVA